MFDLETGMKKVNVDYSGEEGIIEIPAFDEGTTVTILHDDNPLNATLILQGL